MKYLTDKKVSFLGCQSPNFWYKNDRGLKFGRVRVLGQGFNLAGALSTIFAGTGGLMDLYAGARTRAKVKISFWYLF